MKRLLFPAFALAGAMLAVAACDPDLTPNVVPGEGGTEGGPIVTPEGGPPVEAGPTPEGGPTEGGSEAGATHVVDGTNDFTSGEKLATSSPLYDGYVSWDDTNVFFGMSGSDIGGGSSSKWVLIYVDGSPGNAGSAQGIGYDCGGSCASQQASLPFNAGYHLRWKADDSYTNLQKWDGAAWANVGPIGTVNRKGTFMELSITRAALGKPTKLKVHMNMLIEQLGAEWTYAGVPSTSFKDGKSPAAFTKFYEFDLADRAKAPNSYAPKP
ncbi:hypothetical protein BH11MYX4_BH11MYX4_42640 [soil metagenome]